MAFGCRYDIHAFTKTILNSFRILYVRDFVVGRIRIDAAQYATTNCVYSV